eukprot:s8827_g2.t1
MRWDETLGVGPSPSMSARWQVLGSHEANTAQGVASGREGRWIPKEAKAPAVPMDPKGPDCQEPWITGRVRFWSELLEEDPGAILLEQLDGDRARGKPPADLSENGRAGMASLQQAKAGTRSKKQPKAEQWSRSNKGRGQGRRWGSDAYYGCYDETDWPDQPRGKYKGKGKTSGKHDWESWWTSNSGEESQNYWSERQPKPPQWGRTKNGGKGKRAARQYEAQEEGEKTSEKSAGSQKAPKAANTRGHQKGKADGKSKGSGRGKSQTSTAEPKSKQNWKPVATSSK